MSQFQILGRRPFPFKAIPIRFAYTNFPDTIQVIFTDACFLFAVRGIRSLELVHFPYNTNSL